MEVHRVVSVTPQRVGLDEVREHEPLVELLQEPLGLRDALEVRLCLVLLVDVAA